MSLAFKHEASRETLLEEKRRNQARIEELQRRNEAIAGRLAAMEPPTPARMSPRALKGAEEAFRDAVVTFESFTVPELAAHLAWTPARVRKYVAEWIEQERMRETGRFAGQKTYAYIPPTDPGEGFRQDQKIRRERPDLTPAVERAIPLAEGASTGGQLYRQINGKEVRDEVRQALDSGWTLKLKNDGHFVLIKGAIRVGVPTTAQNPSTAAARIRRQVRKGQSTRRLRA